MSQGRCLVLAAATVLLLASSASAEDAGELIDRGVALREEGRDAEALALFRRAWEQEPTPRALAQMALAEQALGRWVDAEAHLSEALSHVDDAWIVSVRQVLEQALTAVHAHLGTLEVRSNVAGATVRIPGREEIVLPAEPVSIPAGEVTLSVSAEGHATVQRTVRIEPGQLSRESVELVPLRGPDVPDASGSSLRLVAFVGAGVAAAGAIVGAIWWAGRQSELDACREGSCANEGTLATTRNFAAATTLTGAALAVAGLVIGVLVSDDDDADGAVACGPDGCLARF